jgi:LysR family cys regulon transcriptional activator
MKLQQLRYVYVVAQRALNISEAAGALHTSQPGVSKQIRLLEHELGVPIFVRAGKRLVSITEPGREVVAGAQRILSEVDNLKKIGAEFTGAQRGTLSIATTHTQARYALPGVLPAFRARYPKVVLRIHQGSPTQIVDMVRSGEADLAIATEGVGDSADLTAMPCYRWNRCVVVPPRHPLLRLRRRITLEDIGAYPLVTYDFAFAGRSQTHQAFAGRGIVPNVVLTAIDADIIKTYVRLGMGVGLMAAMAFDAKTDKPLRAIDASHLFAPSTTWIGVRKGTLLRGYAVDFIATFAPHLTRATIQRTLKGGG